METKQPTMRFSLFVATAFLISISCSNRQGDTTALHSVTAEGVDTIPKIDSLAVNYLMGKFNPEEDDRFDTIPIELADREGLYLRGEALDSYRRMYRAAKAEGIDLQIRSATRNFEYQKGIWERKWTGETKLSTGEDASKAYPEAEDRASSILRYSSMPGTSRHHWGTDIDLNSFDNSWFESGEGLRLFNWLENHAHEYGFCRPYTEKDSLRPNGYNEEKWHWSYSPISDSLTLLARHIMQDTLIQGFEGSEVANSLNIVQNYILGIHECKH